jgi:hypothetical protein
VFFALCLIYYPEKRRRKKNKMALCYLRLSLFSANSKRNIFLQYQPNSRLKKFNDQQASHDCRQTIDFKVQNDKEQQIRQAQAALIATLLQQPLCATPRSSISYAQGALLSGFSQKSRIASEGAPPTGNWVGCATGASIDDASLESPTSHVL